MSDCGLRPALAGLRVWLLDQAITERLSVSECRSPAPVVNVLSFLIFPG